MTALFVAWVVCPITVPVCDGGGVGVGCGGCVGFGVGCCVGCDVGCEVGEGCAPCVAEGDGLAVGDAVGDMEDPGVFGVPVVVPTLGVFPGVVAGALDPAAGRVAICDGGCFML